MQIKKKFLFVAAMRNVPNATRRAASFFLEVTFPREKATSKPLAKTGYRANERRLISVRPAHISRSLR
jgi:hypothetical protein